MQTTQPSGPSGPSGISSGRTPGASSTPGISSIETAPDLVEQAYDALLEAIVSGQLAPGERLRQEQLAASLKVSRQPIVQALMLLRRDGFVEDTGRQGVCVAPVDPDRLGHLYAIRAALDGLAAREAARACASGRIKPDAGMISAGRRAVRSGEVNTMIAADVEFHLHLCRLGGNPLILETLQRHWSHIRRAMGAVLRHADERGAIWDEHAAILEAIANGDGDRAERLARLHAEGAADRLVHGLEADGPDAAAGSGFAPGSPTNSHRKSLRRTR